MEKSISFAKDGFKGEQRQKEKGRRQCSSCKTSPKLRVLVLLGQTFEARSRVGLKEIPWNQAQDGELFMCVHL